MHTILSKKCVLQIVCWATFLGCTVARPDFIFAKTDDPFVTPPVLRELAQNEIAVDANNQEPMRDELTQQANYLEVDRTGESSRNNVPAMTNLKEFLGEKFAKIDWQRMVASLAIVIGAYLILVWFYRIVNPNSSRNLPSQVVEVIGQTRFSAKQNLQLVRLGSKLMLLLVGADGTQSIGEVTDPDEVAYLISLCGKRRNKNTELAIPRRPKPYVDPPASINPVMEQFIKSLQRAMTKPEGSTEYEA